MGPVFDMTLLRNSGLGNNRGRPGIVVIRQDKCQVQAISITMIVRDVKARKC